MDNTNEIEMFSPEEMQSPFEAIKETDGEGREWWNSRKLARLMGYQKYWNFERLMDKVSSFLQQEKGLDLKEHMVEIEEMAQLNNGGYRQVKSIKLSRTACVAIALNADQKKPIVKAAKEYFTSKMNSQELATSVEGNVLIYRSSTGKVNVNVLFSQETFWLSQKRMSELFNVALSTINYHLTQIDESGEVQLSEAIRKIRIPSDNCDEQGVLLYNLDAIIAVGYRVNSYEATQFRIWAREVLKEYIIKGFVMDDERLKGKNPFGADYFEELLDRDPVFCGDFAAILRRFSPFEPFLRRFRGSNLEMRTKNGTLISLYEISKNPLFMGVSRYFRCVIPLGFKPKTFRTGI